VQQEVRKGHIFQIFHEMLLEKNDLISKQVVITILMFLLNGYGLSDLRDQPHIMSQLKEFAHEANSKLTNFILGYIGYILIQDGTVFNVEDYVFLDPKYSTESIVACPQTFQIWNSSWTFASCRASIGVNRKGRFAFEFELMSSGIVQIGWSSDQCKLDPFMGQGVGDDYESYGFDGFRMKFWHGNSFSNV
jgi:hypothetical protein